MSVTYRIKCDRCSRMVDMQSVQKNNNEAGHRQLRGMISINTSMGGLDTPISFVWDGDLCTSCSTDLHNMMQKFFSDGIVGVIDACKRADQSPCNSSKTIVP